MRDKLPPEFIAILDIVVSISRCIVGDNKKALLTLIKASPKAGTNPFWMLGLGDVLSTPLWNCASSPELTSSTLSPH